MLKTEWSANGISIIEQNHHYPQKPSYYSKWFCADWFILKITEKTLPYSASFRNIHLQPNCQNKSFALPLLFPLSVSQHFNSHHQQPSCSPIWYSVFHSYYAVRLRERLLFLQVINQKQKNDVCLCSSLLSTILGGFVSVINTEFIFGNFSCS